MLAPYSTQKHFTMCYYDNVRKSKKIYIPRTKDKIIYNKPNSLIKGDYKESSRFYFVKKAKTS